MGKWRAYRAVVSVRIRALLQYRTAAVAGFITQLFWGVIRVVVFTAFFHSTTRTQPLTLEQMTSYLWLIQAMYALAMWNVDRDVREMIRTGTVAYELLRPVDLYGLWYSRALAARIAPTLLRAVPLFLVATLFLGLRLPPSPLALLCWILSTGMAFALAAGFSTLITISLLYTISGDGIVRMAPILMYVFSGMLLPLPLMPDWAQPILNFLPFRGIVDTPFRFYTGSLPPFELPFALLHQLLWLLVLIFSGRLLLHRAMHRLVIQGG